MELVSLLWIPFWLLLFSVGYIPFFIVSSPKFISIDIGVFSGLISLATLSLVITLSWDSQPAITSAYKAVLVKLLPGDSWTLALPGTAIGGGLLAGVINLPFLPLIRVYNELIEMRSELSRLTNRIRILEESRTADSRTST